MRQAGRYLPEYRATRAQAGSFMGLATNTDYATEVTLQPLERYPLDAAILFSDILTVPDAMGLGLSFGHGRGAEVRRPCATRPPSRRCRARPEQAALRVRRGHLHPPGAERPRAADRLFRQPLDAGLLHGRRRGSDDYRLVKTMLYSRPDLMHRMLAINADAVAAYLNAQIDAGAQAVMIFRQLGRRAGRRRVPGFSLAYTARAGAAQARARRRVRFRASCSPRAAACGFRRCSRRWTARCWAWTGR
jgi:uroporphyrinogen decarboxylase